MSKLRNKTSWRIICVACIALILFTFILPIAYATTAYLNATNDDKYVLWMIPFAFLIIWTVAFPTETYLWYCFSCLFNPKKRDRGTLANVFMALALLLTVFFLWLIPNFLLLNKFTDAFFLTVLSIIIVCQISASIASAIHRAKVRKKQSDTNT